MNRQYILYRQWDTCNCFYVSELPSGARTRPIGSSGKDWGYTTDPTKAIPVSEYWMRRFKSDCAHVGSIGSCYEA